MSHQKNKGTPLPLRKEKLKIADHFNSLTKSYVSDEAQRKTIMQAFLAKKPKSYAQINYKLYRFNSITLGILHLISFVGAVSIVSYLQTLPIGNMAHVLSLVAVLFLLVCEMGQHAMLNVAFENWHATNTVPSRIAAMCVFFSAISIFSSAFGTYHFAQSYNLPSNTILTAMIALSAINEVLILYTTLELHTYQKTVYQESILVNDMHHQNEHSIFFDSMPNVQRMETVLIDANSLPKVSQKPEIILQPQSDKKTGATTAKKLPTNKKVQNAQNAVITSNEGNTGGWNKTDINTLIGSYNGKIRDRKRRKLEPTKEQSINLTFFKEVKKVHDFRSGTFPKVDASKRATYFDNLQTS